MSFVKNIFVAIIGFISFVIFGICLICFYPFCVLKNFEENFVRNGFYKISKFVMSVVKLVSKSFVIKFEEENLEGSCIIVANHSSILDIVAFSSLNFKDIVFITRGWPAKFPLLSKYVKTAGNIVIEENTDFNSLCLQVEAVFNKNLKLVIFPEGTRSKDGTVNRFHKGAFEISQQFGVPIMPVCIKGLDKTIRKNSIIVRSCDVKLTVMKKFIIDKNDSLLDITKKTRQLIIDKMEK